MDQTPDPSSGSCSLPGIVEMPTRPGLETLLQRHAVASKLFKPDQLDPVRLGRFVVVEQIGVGGMGAVFRAYDPQLDRAVALKVHLQRTRGLGGAKQQMFEEAKSLAQLAHPNVVTVHEVGEVEGQVYVAMELVTGGTLREALDAQPHKTTGELRRVLHLLLEAGSGLAAAHDAGIVHHDFKPANVLVGADKRARVADFGLARRTDLVEGSPGLAGAGTPAYMAPEQRVNGPVDARADQFAFCMTAWEVLWGVRPTGPWPPPVPPDAVGLKRRLSRIVQRGLAVDPNDRHPSMHQLLKAMRAVVDPRGSRRRTATVALLGAVAVAAGTYTLSGAHNNDETVCARAAAQLDDAWDPGLRRETLRGLVGSAGEYGRAIGPWLRETTQAFDADWRSNFIDACLTGRRGTESDAVVDRQMNCLDRARASFATLGQQFTKASSDRVSDLVLATAELPRPQACSELHASVEPIELPADMAKQIGQMNQGLEAARIQFLSGDGDQAKKTIENTVESARALGYRPLWAEALVLQGRIATWTGDELSPESLQHAVGMAMETGAHGVAIEGWARWAWMVGARGARPSEVVAHVPIMISLARGMPHHRAARALLHNNVGGVWLAAQRRDKARAAFEEALRLANGLSGPLRTELISAQSNLALVTDDPREQHRLLDEAIAERSAMVGSDHPLTLELAEIRGVLSTEPGEAFERLTDVCSRYRRYHAKLRVARGDCWLEAAWVALASGDPHRAADSMRNVVEALDATGEGTKALAEGYWMLLGRTDPQRAREMFSELVPPADQSVAAKVRAVEVELGRLLAVGEQADAPRLKALAREVGELFAGQSSPGWIHWRLVAVLNVLGQHSIVSDDALSRVQVSIDAWKRGGSTADVSTALLSALTTGPDQVGTDLHTSEEPHSSNP